jgi:xylulokinase
MSKGYLLGIDIGTYESKGVITTLEGELVTMQVNPHKMDIPRAGWAEHDAEKVWWGDFVAVTKKLLAASGIKPEDILGVGISAIAPDLLPVDKDCKPLRSGGILYGVDTRAAAEIDELNTKIGEDVIFKATGNMLSSQAVGPKVLWLKKNEPETFKKAYKFVTASSFIIARLTGNFVIDHLTASFWVPLYDIEKKTWSKELCKDIVEPERLCDILWTPEVAGRITREAAALTGLAEGTPVNAGTADAASEAVSVGVVTPGQMMVMYGSTIFMFAVTPRTVTDKRLWCCDYVFEGTSSLGMGMATSGSLTRWFRDKLAPDLAAAEEAGGENAYSVLVKDAENIPAGSEGLLVLPYFSGERTPINDPRAKGLFFGMTLAHSRAHLFKATLEGMGYGVRHHMDVMRAMNAEPKEIIAVGGGTKNKIWMQAISDICKVPQKVPALTMGASYGNAFLVGLGIGVFKSYTDINNWIKDVRHVQPNPAVADIYDKYHYMYLDLYQNTKDLMHKMYDLNT